MKTIEENLIDKSTWPDGPWKSEPDKRQWLDEETGFACLINRHPSSGHLCGYVGVPHNHPWFGRDDVDADVHGGLNYANKCAGHICHVVEPGEDDNIWWLGFDCAHSGDLSSLSRRGFGFYGDVYRTFEYVADECRSLAQQAEAASMMRGC